MSVGEGSRWLATPRTAVPANARVRYGEGTTFERFYSKVHRPTFAPLTFVDRVEVVP